MCTRIADRAHRPGLARLLLVAVLTVLLVPTGAAASRHGPRTTQSDVERDVMCPTCGTPLIVADSPLADRERAFIGSRIARGEDKEQIKQDMVDEFGPGILARPSAHGFDLSAYLVPVLGVASALAGLMLMLLRWRRRSGRPENAPPPAELTPTLGRQLDEDVARYDL